MNRFMLLVTCVLTCVLLAVPVNADDPPKKLTPEQKKELVAKLKELDAAGFKAYQARKLPEATKSFEEALDVARRLYPKGEFPDGHANLATGLNNLAVMHLAQGKLADAEPLYREALTMLKRLHKGDHPGVASTLINLASLYEAQGKPADAEPLAREALAMLNRLHKGNHPEVARSLSNLAFLLAAQQKLADAETLNREALAMRVRLFKGDHPDIVTSLSNLAFVLQDQGKNTHAEKMLRDALAMTTRLHKGDHPDVADSSRDLALLCQRQGKYADAEILYRDSLAMRKRLFRGDHSDVARNLSQLADLYRDLGRYAAAEPLYKDALAMYKRLFEGDHPAVADSLNSLAGLLELQGKYAEAEPLYKSSLDIRKRLFKGDHPEVADTLNNLALLYEAQKKYASAEPLCRDALEMRKRLFKGDHGAVAQGLNNMAYVRKVQGHYAEAESLYRDALAMRKRLFTGDHPDLIQSTSNLAFLYQAEGKFADAERLYCEALAMDRRLVARYAGQKSEGEALTFIASLPLTRDGFLTNALNRKSDPVAVYEELWASKGLLARIYEQRQQAARVATDPKVADLLWQLVEARRRRAELLLASEVKDPTTRTKREDDLKELEKRLTVLGRDLRPLLPTVARAEGLARVTPTEFREVLPAGTVVVDFLRYTFFEYDTDKPGKAGEKWTVRYLAFVVTRDKVAWVDLDTAAKIEPAVGEWRDAITGGKEIPPALPAKVRELVWEKVRKELPANTKTVYVCPDAALCRVPWGALPGDKPGTILLEDFGVATIPHAPFLLDKLWPQDPLKNPPTGALVVGGVKYDADLAPPAPGAVTRPGDPLLKPGAKLGWSFLPGTAAEATGVFGAATVKKLPVTALKDEQATAPAVLTALPKAKYAHLATHGFFADSSFRSVFQLDEKDYEQSQRGERIGRAANSPLVMTGLVFAGANNPKTFGRGIVTGESLIDLDLSGLELAVLSACETGLGDVAGGEGTFGLQRAFHLAGTRDVVASLWKVPDQSTAALMALFYRNLWDKNLTPMESLRQAQLEIYRTPAKIPELAKGFRGKFEEVPGATDAEVKAGKDGKAHPLLWAAFTLSGPGR